MPQTFYFEDEPTLYCKDIDSSSRTATPYSVPESVSIARNARRVFTPETEPVSKGTAASYVNHLIRVAGLSSFGSASSSLRLSDSAFLLSLSPPSCLDLRKRTT